MSSPSWTRSNRRKLKPMHTYPLCTGLEIALAFRV
jgi:hypothetical protein